MKKYLWIAGGAALLISAFFSRNGVSHAQPSEDQDRRDPRPHERARRKPTKRPAARKTLRAVRRP